MSIYLERAEEKDCDLIFNWTNDDKVRNNSFNQNKIKYEDHVKWFKEKLKSNSCYMFIFYIEKTPVGQIRIDIEGYTGVISYSIDKNYRYKGLSKEMLSLLESEARESTNIRELIGYVKFDNTASQKVFEKLGYIKIVEDEYLRYYKILGED